MRVQKTPTRKRRGGGIRFKSVIDGGMKRALKVGVTLIASLAMLTSGTALAAEKPSADAKRADANTSGTYAESLGKNNSTRYAGRVWNDKTVSDSDMAFSGQTADGQSQSYTIEQGESNFLVTYSTLATSQTIIGQHPTDTVFILDFSTSMTWGYQTDHESVARQDSRIQAMVDSVNSAIGTLVHASGQNRIGIAVFNGRSTQLVPLTTAEEILQHVSNGQYLEITNYSYTSGKDGGTATVHSNINNATTTTDGGTNIQAGLFAGMSMLANSNDTTVTVAGESVTRIPNVVLMSDGAPTTFSSSTDASYYDEDDHWRRGQITNDTNLNTDRPVESGSWWSTSSGEAIGSGNNDDPDSADGFTTLLMAAYYKNRINDHYYSSGDGTANIYTIGFGTDVQTPQMVAMANLVLNPAEHLGVETDFPEVNAVASAWQTYSNGEEPVVHAPIGHGNNTTLVDYEVERPADKYAPTSLEYPTQAFSAADGDQLNQIFQQIASLITDQAKAPTKVDGGLDSSGYITYTDPIGEYMNVDSVKALLWAGTLFDKVGSTSDGNGTHYTFETKDGSDIISSPINGIQYSTEIIEVTVATDVQTGRQTLTVRIPAAAIPLRVNTVTLDGNGGVESNTSNNAYPLRLIYGVSLNDDILNENGVLNTSSDVGSEYIEKHPGDTAGSVSFYTNLYSGKQFSGNDLVNGNGTTVGDANVTFQPADDNPFYFVQENIPLYVDGSASGSYNSTTQELEKPQPATESIDPATTYYFPITFYEETNKVKKWVARPGSQLQRYVDATGTAGQLEIQQGSPRLGNLTDLSRPKASDGNATGTAAQRLYPTFEANGADPHNGQFRVYLGNNGSLQVPTVQPTTLTVDQALAVTKHLQGKELSDDTNADNNFEFTVAPQQTMDDSGKTVTTAEDAGAKLQPSDTSDGSNDGTLHFNNDAASMVDGTSTSVMHPITQGLTFTVDDINKAYTYKVAEVVPGDHPVGYDYDETTHTVVYSVSRQNSQLVIEVTVDGVSVDLNAATPTVEFNNTYIPPVSVLPLTGGDATARNFAMVGGGVLLLAGVAWLLARRRRV
ncbi:hypothetical protein BSAE_1308 [Bifidobacterium pullorum subsp. saeculare DSM 6531 = LMG 14934]|uniref:Uncharacterized protein n=2 Tax=Bifidobacterium pullorum TaxID=78448 RepID=A0A087CQA5_9BIFI|nr:hypothetical protein BSAE_1308 [Bifidobacterium pullorum subsp. saeculare DSM 6531 = LMG 14934]